MTTGVAAATYPTAASEPIETETRAKATVNRTRAGVLTPLVCHRRAGAVTSTSGLGVGRSPRPFTLVRCFRARPSAPVPASRADVVASAQRDSSARRSGTPRARSARATRRCSRSARSMPGQRASRRARSAPRSSSVPMSSGDADRRPRRCRATTGTTTGRQDRPADQQRPQAGQQVAEVLPDADADLQSGGASRRRPPAVWRVASPSGPSGRPDVAARQLRDRERPAHEPETPAPSPRSHRLTTTIEQRRGRGRRARGRPPRAPPAAASAGRADQQRLPAQDEPRSRPATKRRRISSGSLRRMFG